MNDSAWDRLTDVAGMAIPFAIGCLVIVLLAWFGPRGRRRLDIRGLVNGEDGASYTLSMAFVIPIYVLMIAMITECAVMMVVKLGTMNAAFAAARAACVWQPAEITPKRREEMVHLAAAQALAPFASSRDVHLQPTGYAGQIGSQANRDFAAAYLRFSGGSAPFEYLAKKRLYALAATTVELEAIHPNDPAKAAINVTVTFEKPIDFPIIGVVLGERASWPGARFFSRKISSTTMLHLEIPKSTSRRLGINYDSWEY
jgi:Flp pilus assembly protein TadG